MTTTSQCQSREAGRFRRSCFLANAILTLQCKRQDFRDTLNTLPAREFRTEVHIAGDPSEEILGELTIDLGFVRQRILVPGVVTDACVLIDAAIRYGQTDELPVTAVEWEVSLAGTGWRAVFRCVPAPPRYRPVSWEAEAPLPQHFLSITFKPLYH